MLILFLNCSTTQLFLNFQQHEMNLETVTITHKAQSPAQMPIRVPVFFCTFQLHNLNHAQKNFPEKHRGGDWRGVIARGNTGFGRK